MIPLKTPQEIEIMSEGGKILAGIMEELKKTVRPGITTKTLNELAEELIFKYGAPHQNPARKQASYGAGKFGTGQGKCSFKGYQGFPACLCTSINEEIVHAVPSNRILEEGDIISLDLGFHYKGFHTDMARTFPVGKISARNKRLIEVTKKSLEMGIEKVKPGNRIGDISRVIQKYAESQGFNVVRELCGHGIGRKIHEDPEILNAVSFEKEMVDKVKFVGDGNIKIKEGMVLCLEPMVTVGDWHIKKLAPYRNGVSSAGSKDSFAFVTKDGSLSAHFEHTIAVTKNGYKILTIS